MTVRNLKVWAVIALWAVAAGSTHGEEVYLPTAAGGVWVEESFMDVPVSWREAPVAVDGEYASEHPEQRGLQAVVADVRETVSDHEKRISGLEGDIADLEIGQSTTPTQSQGGDIAPATAPARGVINMESVQVAQGVTAGQLVGVVIALGMVGVLVWIAVLLGRREDYGLATLAQVLNLGEGEVRGSATAPDGRSVAFRASGINPEARAAALQAAQPAPPAAPGLPPAQIAAIVNALQGVGAGPTAANVAAVIAQGLTQGVDFLNQGAVQTLVQNLVAQGLVT